MRFWFPKFPQIFSSIADVVTVLGFLGVPSIPVYMVLVWAVGWTMGVDFFWVLALGPIASFAILGTVLCGVLLFRRGPKQAESLDLTRWVEHGSYFVWVAACLWSNQKPWPNIPADSPSYPMLQKLKGAIQTGQINVLSGDGGMTSRVSHEELVRYANTIGERPAFLFPAG